MAWLKLYVTVSVLFVLNCVVCEVVDLTWDFNNKTIYWDNKVGFEYTKRFKTNKKGHWYAHNSFAAPEHGGTHIDAPFHHYKKGWKVSDIPIKRLFVQASLIDVSRQVGSVGPRYKLEVRDLKDWEKRNGPFPKNSLLIIKFGWSKFYRKGRKIYLGIRGKKKVFPGISTAAAKWIVNSKKFYGVGFDTGDVGPKIGSFPYINELFSKKNIYMLKMLKIEQPLPATGLVAIVAPMKLEEGTGGPARVIVIDYDKKNGRAYIETEDEAPDSTVEYVTFTNVTANESVETASEHV